MRFDDFVEGESSDDDGAKECVGQALLPAKRRGGRPNPANQLLLIGFTGQEIDWLPEVMRILRDQLPNIDVTETGLCGGTRTLDPRFTRGKKLASHFLEASA